MLGKKGRYTKKKMIFEVDQKFLTWHDSRQFRATITWQNNGVHVALGKVADSSRSLSQLHRPRQLCALCSTSEPRQLQTRGNFRPEATSDPRQLQTRGNFRPEATSDPRQLQTRGFRPEGLRNLRNPLRGQTPCARQSKWHGSW